MVPHNTKRVAIGTAAILLAAGALTGMACAQKSGVPVEARAQDKLVQGEEPAKQIVILLGEDNNGKPGKVSREEFLKFMEAEFARLDKDRNGQVDVKEMEQARPAANLSAKGSK